MAIDPSGKVCDKNLFNSLTADSTIAIVNVKMMLNLMKVIFFLDWCSTCWPCLGHLFETMNVRTPVFHPKQQMIQGITSGKNNRTYSKLVGAADHTAIVVLSSAGVAPKEDNLSTSSFPVQRTPKSEDVSGVPEL